MKIVKIVEEFHPNYGPQCIENVTATDIPDNFATLEDAQNYINDELRKMKYEGCEDLDEESAEYADRCSDLDDCDLPEVQYTFETNSGKYGRLTDNDTGEIVTFVIKD